MTLFSSFVIWGITKARNSAIPPVNIYFYPWWLCSGVEWNVDGMPSTGLASQWNCHSWVKIDIPRNGLCPRMASNLPVHRNGLDKSYHSCTYFGSTGLEEWPYFEPWCYEIFGWIQGVIRIFVFSENRLKNISKGDLGNTYFFTC